MAPLNFDEMKPGSEPLGEDLLREAIEREEREATQALGFEPCPGEHDEELLPCRSCGAAL